MVYPDKITPNLDLLDRTLLQAKRDTTTTTAHGTRVMSEKEIELIEKAFYKLQKDGFIQPETSESHITFNGLLALEECPWPYRNRPYRWAKAKQNIKLYWEIGKVIVITLNAVLLLIFAFFSAFSPFIING
jgi:hypothetical protein